jgi:hypothetical protein
MPGTEGKMVRPNMNAVDGYETVGLPMPLTGVLAANPPALLGEMPHVPLAAVLAENQTLMAELSRLRAEREAWVDQQLKIMELLGTELPERILHDLRNVLNERELFRALASLEP